MIECICVVCHRPIERTRQAVTAVTCGANCCSTWHRLVKRGKRLPWKYEQARALQAYRRELRVMEMGLKALLSQGGWLEVG